eukprot:gene11095-7748_t
MREADEDCPQCDALLGILHRSKARKQLFSVVIRRIMDMTGATQKDAVLKYMELGRDEDATVEALGELSVYESIAKKVEWEDDEVAES